jgi:hypothetical protein
MADAKHSMTTDAKHSEIAQRMGDIADDLICPITQELPLDPVIAEDGRIYERAAISQWIYSQGAKIRSPMTNQPMGPRLLPAIQVRNTIEKLIHSEVLGVDAVARFTERRMEAAEVQAMRIRAENGDDTATLHMAIWHQYGLKGLPLNARDCFLWFKRAADAGNARGIACAGECYISGEGVEQNEPYGLHLMTIASERGSEAAAFCLGLWFAEGLHGLPMDVDQAKFWLRKVIQRTSVYPGLSADARELAGAMLEELTNPASDTDDALLGSSVERDHWMTVDEVTVP